MTMNVSVVIPVYNHIGYTSACLESLRAHGGEEEIIVVANGSTDGTPDIARRYADRTVRFFDRRNTRYSDDIVHERVVGSGRVGECRHHLMHYSFSGISDLLAKLDLYGDLSAPQMFERGRKWGLLDLTARPAFAFLKTCFLRLGWLDGVEGLVVSVTTALLTFTKYVKPREMERKRP